MTSKQSTQTAICLGLLVMLVRCWSEVGHMLTASIAQTRLNQLDPFTAKHFRDLLNSINALVNEEARTFIESACWPDDIKSSKINMGIWNPWHYKDSAYVLDYVTPVINYTEGSVNGINMINLCKNTLKMNTLRNTAERALAARYLVHLVGDMHQPLHAVSLFNKTYPKGDGGGNSFTVIAGGNKYNFHSYWDAGGYKLQNTTYFYKRPMNLQNNTALGQFASDMVKQYGTQIQTLALSLDPFVWAQESFRFAQNTTYLPLENGNILTQDYAALTFQVSKKRIVLAGYRLANLVIDLYKNTTVPRKEVIDRKKLWEQLNQDSITVNMMRKEGKSKEKQLSLEEDVQDN